MALNRYEPYTYFWDSRNPEPIRKFLNRDFHMSEIVETKEEIPEPDIQQPIADRPNNYRDLLPQVMKMIEDYPKFGEILFLKLKTKYGVYKP